MSSEDPTNAPVRRDAREAVREKAQQVHAQQKRARWIRRSLLAVGAVVVVGVVIGSIGWVVGSNAAKPQAAPTNVVDDGFIVTSITGDVSAAAGVEGEADAAEAAEPAPTEESAAEPADVDEPLVDIRVYVDYLAEGSRNFQVANEAQLTTWVDSGAATLTYHPVAMLSAKSNGTKYSLRAAAASACVATLSPDAFYTFNHELLINQPEVDSDGLSDKELADLAQASGAKSPKVVRACIEEQKYTSWAREATDRALAGIPDTDDLTLTSAPTVLVNGQPYVGALDDAAEFSQFVMTIASDAYYEGAPTPTPSPAG